MPTYVNAVDVGPLLPVDLDGHEGAVEEVRNLPALERLVLHHMAPARSAAQHAHRCALQCTPQRTTLSRAGMWGERHAWGRQRRGG